MSCLLIVSLNIFELCLDCVFLFCFFPVLDQYFRSRDFSSFHEAGFDFKASQPLHSDKVVSGGKDI